MKKEKIITIGEYSMQLRKKITRINRRASVKKIRRIIVLCLAVVVCVFSIIFGINTKTSHLEIQYQKYSLEKDRTMLDSMLLEYKDTLQIFEQTSLGNTISQTQMGGFYYNNGSVLIYPDIEVGDTKIEIDGKASSLTDGFASNINFYKNNVYFRNAESMELMKYDISTQTSSKVDLESVEHFIICDGIIVFKDMSTGELKLVQEGADPELISSNAIVSFAIAGNQILYLQDDHTLHSVNISTRIDEVIANNVSSFFFNGDLWLQNNTDIYVRSLAESSLSPLTCEENCRRILGMTSDYLIFDGSDALCVYNLIDQHLTQLSPEFVFVGASDNGMLVVYNMEMRIYQSIQP